MRPDPENKVGDQHIGSPGRPVSSGLQVPGEPFHSWSGYGLISIPVLTVISVFCALQWNPSLVPLWNQFLRIHNKNTHFLRIKFNIIFPYLPTLSFVSCTLKFLSKHCKSFSSFPWPLTKQPYKSKLWFLIYFLLLYFILYSFTASICIFATHLTFELSDYILAI
jgi:hypothetical protein